MTNNKPECGNCRYFHAGEETPRQGACCAHPPVRIRGEQDGWPFTLADYWCGEWRAKVEAADEIERLRKALYEIAGPASDPAPALETMIRAIVREEMEAGK